MTTDALDNLVHQFSDPYSFLRELVQNAIDAGTREIDVETERRGDVSEIHIIDYGEGMDRHIIDSKLTRLFSSSKDADRTKIGRFGIGFVSVFAIEPDLVVVDTARGGECWRVVFTADRSFERIRLDDVVEGTTVRIVKRLEADEHEAWVERCRETLDYWCRHVQVELRFDGEVLSRPLAVDADVQVHATRDDIRVVAGYVEGPGQITFHNRGLTLHREIFLREPPVVVAVDSPRLEHTLTRNQIVEDSHHAEVSELVQKVCDDELPRALLRRIEAQVREGSPVDDALYDALAGLAKARVELDGELAVGRDAESRVVSLSKARKASRTGRLAVVRAGHPILGATQAAGYTAVVDEGRGGLARALAALGLDAIDPEQNHFAPEACSLPNERDSHFRQLAAKMLEFLKAAGHPHGLRPQAIVPARLRPRHAALRRRFAVACRPDLALTPLSWVTDPRGPKDAHVLAVDVDHPSLGDYLELCEFAPHTAAYLASKHVLLPGRLNRDIDERLIAHYLEQA